MSEFTKEIYDEVLNWDYFCTKDSPENISPEFRKKQQQPEPNSFSTLKLCKPLQDSFNSVPDYLKAFQPLLRLETWAGVSKSRFQLRDDDYFTITPYEDKYISTPKTAISKHQQVTVVMSSDDFENFEIAASDVLLVTFYDKIKFRNQFVKLKYKYDYALAIVSKVIYSSKTQIKLCLNINLPFEDFEVFPNPIRTWNAIKLTTLIPVEREYNAIHKLGEFKLKNQILKGIPSVISENWENDPNSKEFIRLAQQEHGLNQSQAEAISGILRVKGVSLIQGPPGTGKTKTIVAMMGALLSYSQISKFPPLIMGQKLPEKYQPIRGLRVEQEKLTDYILECKVNEDIIEAIHNHIDEISEFLDNEILRLETEIAIEPPIRRILICTPSNKAVDEVLYRVVTGMLGLNLQMEKEKDKNIYPRVVRVGRSTSMKQNIKDYSLENIVKKQLGWCQESVIQKFYSEIQSQYLLVMNEVERLRERNKEIETEIKNVKQMMDLEDREYYNSEDENSSQLKIESKRTNIDRNTAKISSLEEGRSKYNHVFNSLEQIMEKCGILKKLKTKEVLQNSNIVCSTLSGSGQRNIVSAEVSFPLVIIDEAAQSAEPTSLVPFQFGCEQCIMVGDPKQLPPTVISKIALSNGYDRSLFVRFFEKKNQVHSNPVLSEDQDNDEYGSDLELECVGSGRVGKRAVFLLNTQYRMHPEISQFPSEEFYNGQVMDGPNMNVLTKSVWHNWNFTGQEFSGSKTLLGPLQFFNLHNGVHEKSERTPSLYNKDEVMFVFELYTLLGKELGRENIAGKIGIVAPYREQMFQLRKKFSMEYGDSVLDEIEFTTIDGFQGQEKEIIIFHVCEHLAVLMGRKAGKAREKVLGF